MYSYEWDKATGGYLLTTQTESSVANELRPVFAEELTFYGFHELSFDSKERNPLMWAIKNRFYYQGKLLFTLNPIQYGHPITATFAFRGKKKIKAVNIKKMVQKNEKMLEALVTDTLKSFKEKFDALSKQCSIQYIAFSGGKDSVALLELAHRALPLDVPVVFSDTDMELRDTDEVWRVTQKNKRYKGRTFIKAKAALSALESWKSFGPPSRTLRWCCSVHKSTPAILELRQRYGLSTARPKLLAFVGVRSGESTKRAKYEDVADEVKSQNQINCSPILKWSAHELWLFIFENNLIINKAYRKGLQRVGCILCPMSSNRHAELVRQLYKKKVASFADIIIQSSSKEFSSKKDAENFVYEGGWHARNNGSLLKEFIELPRYEQNENTITFLYKKRTLKSGILEWAKILKDVNIVYKDKHIIFEGTTKQSIKFISTVINKAINCIACRACEAECPFGAVSFMPKIAVRQDNCKHCGKCLLSNEEGCLYFYSKRITRGTSMKISGIGKYQTFGLQPSWIAHLAETEKQFRNNDNMGKNMIESAIPWFREAGLITESKNIDVTLLLKLGQRLGFGNPTFWDFLFVGLASRSPLVKWFICNFPIGKLTNRVGLDTSLSDGVASAATRKSAVSSLLNLFKNSPLGTGDHPLVALEMKGKTVASFTRQARECEPLVTLYGLYLMAQLAQRASWRVRDMLTADFDSISVSPIVAFGLTPEQFKTQCVGLASRHSDFIQCHFTHGLDEVKLFPDTKTLDDVVNLYLTQ